MYIYWESALYPDYIVSYAVRSLIFTVTHTEIVL